MRLLFIILVIAMPAFGQTISGVTGVLDNGSTVTISGSGFLTKIDNTELMWDDLSYYSGYSDYDECQLVAGNPWAANSTYTDNPYYYGSADSVRVAGRPVYGSTRAGAYFIGYDYPIADNSPLSINFWVWMNSTEGVPGATHVTKLIRIWGDGNSLTRADLFYDSTMTYSSAGVVEYTYFDDGLPAIESWHHMEMIFYNSDQMTTDPATTLAYYDMYLNGQLAHPQQPLVGDMDDPDQGGTFSAIPRFGFDVRGAGYYDDWPEGTIVRWGDIYIDEGISKVLITDVNDFTWDNASPVHWEIQPVTSWTDTSVDFTVNGGSFAEGASVYVYVIDSDGDISNAHAVILGEDGGGDIPFTAPSNLTVTGGN